MAYTATKGGCPWQGLRAYRKQTRTLVETLSGALFETSGTESSGSFHLDSSLARAQSGVKAAQSSPRQPR